MDNDTTTFKIRFEDVSVAEAGTMASQLRRDLLDTSPDVQVEIDKDDPNTQDFGATLVLLLGAPAIVAIAKGLADYYRRTGSVVTVYGSGEGTTEPSENVLLKIENVEGADAAKIAEALSGAL